MKHGNVKEMDVTGEAVNLIDPWILPGSCKLSHVCRDLQMLSFAGNNNQGMVTRTSNNSAGWTL